MGAGRTELLETLFGVYSPRRTRGRLTLAEAGNSPLLTSPAAALRAGLAFVTEDRKEKSLVLGLSVGHNITLAALGDFLQGGVIRSQPEQTAVSQSIGDLHIKTPSPEVLVGTLSGGNQQKVVLAKCLLTHPKVLLLDEPTRGIDVGAKAEIYALINHLAQERRRRHSGVVRDARTAGALRPDIGAGRGPRHRRIVTRRGDAGTDYGGSGLAAVAKSL